MNALLNTKIVWGVLCVLWHRNEDLSNSQTEVEMHMYVSHVSSPVLVLESLN